MKKKFTMLLASLFLVMGTAWAQPEEGQLYRIKNVATSFYLDITSTQTNGIKINTLDETSLNQCFYFIPKDTENNVYYIKSANNQYVAIVNGSGWDMCATNAVPNDNNSAEITLVSTGEEKQYYLQTNNIASWGHNMAPNDDSNGAEGSPVYSDKAQSAKYVKWLFEEVQLSIVELVVNYTLEGQNVKSITLQGVPGGEVEVPALDYTKIVSCKIGEEEQTVTDGACIITVPEAAATVTVELEANLPFEVSTDYENATWYALQIRPNKDTKYIVRSESAPYANSLTTPTSEDALWAFVGNPFDGVQVLNKAAGTGKTLALDANNNAVMTEGTTTWNITKGNGGFLLRNGNEGVNYLHDFNSTLKIWADNGAATDPGSAFVVTSEAEMISLATTAMGLASKLDTYAEASYYTYPNAAVAEAKATLQDVATPTTILAALRAKATVESVQAALNTAGKSGAPAADDFIMLKNKACNFYLTDNGTNAKVETLTKSAAAVWKVVAGENGVMLQNSETNRFLGNITTSESTPTEKSEGAKEFVWENKSDMYAVFKPVGGDAYQYGHRYGNNLVGWEAAADASQWIVTNVRPLSVIYKYNDEVLSETTEYVEYGSVYTVISPYDFTVPTACKKGEEALEAVDGVFSFEVTDATTLTVELADDLPFTMTVLNQDGSFPENTAWYVVKQHSTAGYGQAWKYDETNGVTTESTTTYTDNHLWCFAGNKDDLKIYNKVAGKGFSLTNTDPASMAAENAAVWKMVKSAAEASFAGESPFCLQNGDATSYLNRQGNALMYWTYRDQGSTIMVIAQSAIELEALVNRLNGTIDAMIDNAGNGIGYYESAEDVAKLKNAIDKAQVLLDSNSKKNEDYVAAIAELKELETKAAKIELPEAGKYYRIGYDFGSEVGIKYMESESLLENKLNMTSDAEGLSTIFYYADDKLQSLSTKKYLKEDGNTRGLQDGANNAGKITFSTCSELGKIKIQAPAYLHANKKGDNYFMDHCGSDEDGHKEHIFIVREVPTVQLNVTYKLADKASKTFIKSVPIGYDYIIDSPNDFVSISSVVAGEETISAVEGVWKFNVVDPTDVVVTLVEMLPFKTSTDFANANWQYLQMNSSAWKYVQKNEGDDNTSSVNVSSLTDRALWAFVGDAINGFKILNKGVEGAALSVDATSNGSIAYMKASGDQTWTIEKGNGGFIIRQGANECINDYAGEGIMKIWKADGAPNGAGSAFRAISASVTDLADLRSPGIFTLQADRSPLLYDVNAENPAKLSSGMASGIGANGNDINQQFIISESDDIDGLYYLYSVGAGKFVDANLNFTDYPEPVLSFEANSNNPVFPWFIKIDGKYVVPGIGGTAGNKLHHQETVNNDDGKRYRIEQVDINEELASLVIERIKIAEYKAAAKTALDMLTFLGVDDEKTAIDDVEVNRNAFETIDAIVNGVAEYVAFRNAETNTTSVRYNNYLGVDMVNSKGNGHATFNHLSDVWSLKYTGQGSFYIYNVNNKVYLGNPGSNGALAATPNAEYTFELIEGKVEFKSGGQTLHLNNHNTNNVVSTGTFLSNYDNDDAASRWYVETDFPSHVEAYKTSQTSVLESLSGVCALVGVSESLATAKTAIDAIATTDYATFSAIDTEVGKVTDAIAAKHVVFQNSNTTDAFRSNVYLATDMSDNKGRGNKEFDYNAVWNLRHAGGAAFYLYNGLHKVYLGNPSGEGALTAAPAASYTFEVVDASTKMVELKSGGQTLHVHNWSDCTLTNWDGDESASRWYVSTIDITADIQALITANASNHAEVPELGQYTTAGYNALVAAKSTVKNIEEVDAAIIAFKATLNRPVYFITSAWDNGYSAGSAIYYDGAAWKWKTANIFDKQMWMAIPDYTEENVPTVNAYDENGTSYEICDYLTSTVMRGKKVQIVEVEGWDGAYSLQYNANASSTDAAQHAQNGGALVSWKPALANDCQASAWHVEYIGNSYDLDQLTDEYFADAAELAAVTVPNFEFSEKMNQYDQNTKPALDAAIANRTTVLSKFSTAEEIAAAKSLLETAIAGVQLNMPKNGKFYRVRCAGDGMKRLQSTINNDRLQMIGGEAGINASSIFCYVNGSLLSYTTGLYINAYNFDAVGKNSTVTFSKAYNGALGQYNIKINDSSRYIYGKKSEIDSGTGDPADNGYNWWLEEVTTLPVSISEVGYTTFYTPIAVEVPEEVEAYIVLEIISEEDNKFLDLKKVTGIVSAHIGLILKGKGTYDFAVAATAAEDEQEFASNLLQGTNAKTIITPDANTTCYVLAKTGETANPVAFYPIELGRDDNGEPLEKDKEGNIIEEDKATSFLNGANKVYLPVETPGGQAPALMFRFGTTEVEDIVADKDTEPIIYDLMGRRVEKMVEGIYIVNGRKVVIK